MMEDRRGQILLKCDEIGDCVIFDGCDNIIAYDGEVQPIYNAMDENGKQMCLDLLEYMANNGVDCRRGISGEPVFLFQGKAILKEELFENFL